MSDECLQCGLPLCADVEPTMQGDPICGECAKQLTHMASKAEQRHRKYEELRTKAEANFKKHLRYQNRTRQIMSYSGII